MLTLTSACSSLPTGTKSLVMLPMCIMQAVFLNTSYFIWLENPEMRKENCWPVYWLTKLTKDVKSLISELHVLPVVDGGHSEFALGHVPVVLDV